MSNEELIKSHKEQLGLLEIERNIAVFRAKGVKEVQLIIRSYARDIKVYEDDINKIETDM